ncbi:MAG: hypothetical protein H6737_12940 [Alphaproteobacteria bacterium]|nr:hypothetical protein [Alphaproteobacteria bacterium]
MLVVDEVGYLAYSNDAANVPHDQDSMSSTTAIWRSDRWSSTNKSPLNAWGDVLHDRDLAEAIVDRILERGRLLVLSGPSHRTQHITPLETSSDPSNS